MAVGSGNGRGRPFEKGKSGNPKGRPKKGESYSEILAQMATVKDIKLENGTTIERKRALCELFWTKALQNGDLKNGDVYAAKFIIERLEGKTPIQMSGVLDQDGNPTPIPMVLTIQRMTIEEWRKTYNEPSSGSPNLGKPKPSRVPRKKSSSEELKAAGRATSSSGTTSRTTKSGAKPGKESSSAGRTKSSKKSSEDPSKS